MNAKILFISLLTMYTLTSYSKSPVKKSDKIVYICDGPKAKVYHSSPNCRGLNRCSGNIVKVSVSKAKEMGRRPCKICY